MLEALVYFVVAFAVTSVLLPILFAKELNLSSKTDSRPASPSKPVSQPPPDRTKMNVYEEYYYTMKDDGVQIEGCVYTDRLVLRIPSTINYVPVRFIGDKAFQDCTNLRKVLIPDHVAKIGYSAFSALEKLTVYARPGSYAEQYARENHIAFSDVRYFNTPKAQKIAGRDKTKIIEKKPSNRYYYKTDLPKTIRMEYYDVERENGGLTIKKFVGVDKALLEVPAELCGLPVLAIDTGAFRNCKYIEKVIIGEDIQEIRSGAFQNCPKLQELHIPNSVQTIGENLFVNDGDGVADKNVNIIRVETKTAYKSKTKSKSITEVKMEAEKRRQALEAE